MEQPQDAQNSRKQRRKAAAEHAAAFPETAEDPTFAPPVSGDPAESTATIVPVTANMMDHAAHQAAEQVVAAAFGPRDAEQPLAALTADPQEIVPSPVPDVTAGISADPRPEPDAPADAAPAAVASESRAVPDPVATDVATAWRGMSPPPATAEAFGRYSAKVIEIVGANLAATSDLLSALLQAKSLPEVAAIGTTHVRQRFDAATMQSRELMLLAQKVALDAVRPLQDATRSDRDP